MRFIFALLLCCSILSIHAQNKSSKLWYEKPAKVWTEALPLGNGRLGAMVFGRFDRERIQLNEESLWGGAPINNNNPLAKKHLPEIQNAIFENRLEEAKDLATKYMVGTPPRIRSYQTLGDIFIDYSFTEKDVKKYNRVLDLTYGIHTSEFAVGDNKVEQRVFVSADYNAILIEVSSKERIDFSIEMLRSRDVNEYGHDKNSIYYNGQINDEESPSEGPHGKHMRFNTTMKVVSVDGKYTCGHSDSSASVNIKGAKRLVLAFTSFTDYNIDLLNIDKTIDPQLLSKKVLDKIIESKLPQIEKDHKKEHSSIFDRVSFQLEGNDFDNLPTDKRIASFKIDKSDVGLPILFYQYGRYLLMSSSRAPGKLPANLQGIWNQEYKAPWNSDFHTNINLQMNYWPAETGNLPETSKVLNAFMKQITKPGTVTAQEMYGARGWTMHHLTDVFGRTGVADGVWGVSPMNGPWMTMPLYRHYEFNSDKAYLKTEIYSTLKGSVLWILDFLIKSPKGEWVTNPSHSPENTFYYTVKGQKMKSQLTYGSTIDIQIIEEVFNNFEEAANLLNMDKDLVARVNLVRKDLPKVKITKQGTIQEWIEDYEEVEPGHRHMSHLLGLYPGKSIRSSAALEAARKTIEKRLSAGGGHTGWSLAWIINFYARLQDGEQANTHLTELISKTCLPNMFSTHPPFQIDGNFGGAAGIAEMLMQSHDDKIEFLPAIPNLWKSGSLKGMKTRGNLIVNLEWKDGNISALKIHSKVNRKVKLAFKQREKSYDLKVGWNTMTSL